MKTTVMIAAMAAAAFGAGVLTSCSKNQAPQPAPPVQSSGYTVGK